MSSLGVTVQILSYILTDDELLDQVQHWSPYMPSMREVRTVVDVWGTWNQGEMISRRFYKLNSGRGGFRADGEQQATSTSRLGRSSIVSGYAFMSEPNTRPSCFVCSKSSQNAWISQAEDLVSLGDLGVVAYTPAYNLLPLALF